MTATDTLVTLFEARGAASLLSTFTNISLQQRRMEDGQNKIRNATSGPQIKQGIAQVRSALNGLVSANLAAAAASGTLFAGIAYGLGKAVQGYSKLATQIMNIRDLTGATTGDSARASSLFGVAGMHGSAGIKQLLGLNKSVFSGTGAAALARLGIPTNPSQSSLQIFNQVADKLNGMQDGMRKTRIMLDLFGEGGAESMLPLLRMTKEQREAAMSLADAYSTDGLKAVQEFQVANSLLGETVEQRVKAPIVQAILPALTALSKGITGILNLYHQIDEATGGRVSMVVAWVAVSAGVATAAMAMTRFIGALRAALAIARQLAVVQTVIAAMSNPGKALIGLAVAGVSIAGISALMNQNASEEREGLNEVAGKFGSHVDRMGDYITKFGDIVDMTRGKGTPGNLSQIDIGAISRQQALGAIG